MHQFLLLKFLGRTIRFLDLKLPRSFFWDIYYSDPIFIIYEFFTGTKYFRPKLFEPETFPGHPDRYDHRTILVILY